MVSKRLWIKRDFDSSMFRLSWTHSYWNQPLQPVAKWLLFYSCSPSKLKTAFNAIFQDLGQNHGWLAIRNNKKVRFRVYIFLRDFFFSKEWQPWRVFSTHHLIISKETSIYQVKNRVCFFNGLVLEEDWRMTMMCFPYVFWSTYKRHATTLRPIHRGQRKTCKVRENQFV